MCCRQEKLAWCLKLFVEFVQTAAKLMNNSDMTGLFLYIILLAVVTKEFNQQ